MAERIRENPGRKLPQISKPARTVHLYVFRAFCLAAAGIIWYNAFITYRKKDQQ